MSRCPKLVVDTQLTIDAALLATGADVHAINNMLLLYQGAANCFNVTRDATWKLMFESKEKMLREFVRKAMVAKCLERMTNAPPEFLIGSSPTGDPSEAS